MTYLLAIETSCDETAAAIIQDGTKILSNVVSSQVNIHKKYGGIVPEIAARQHAELLHPVMEEALEKAHLTYQDLSAVAATYAPGLIGSLIVGLVGAKGIALAQKIPFIGVNHLEGHLYSTFLRLPPPEDERLGIVAICDDTVLPFPFLSLIVSGGHTSLVLARAPGKYQTIGETLDDACGEAFDKVARLLGLGYPGGPIIDRLAKSGDPHAIPFPKILTEKNSHDFSYSGLKTAVAHYLTKTYPDGTTPSGEALHDIAASFQYTALEVLIRKMLQAAAAFQVQHLSVVGGVSANSMLRSMAEAAAVRAELSISIPPLIFSTDNAAMVGVAGYQKWQRGETSPLSLPALSIQKLI